MSALRGFVFLVLGSAAYRLSALVLLSLYASRLGPEQFGWLEQLLAVSLLIVPLLSVQAHEAVLASYQKNAAVAASTAACIVLCAATLAIAIGAGLSWLGTEPFRSALPVAAYVATTIVWQFVRNILRAEDRFDITMQSEVVLSAISLSVGSILLFGFDYGVSAALAAIASGNVAASVYALMRTRSRVALFGISSIRLEAFFAILSVSFRLLPNVALWWAIELSDRLILAHFRGDHAVGLYSAGARVAGILMAVMLLLYQVWQVPAIRAIERGEGARFLASTFRPYVLATTLSASLLLSAAEPLTALLLGEAYAESLRYTAILVPALCLAALCYFFGICYYTESSKRSAVTASAAGFGVSLLINITGIPVFGATAAAASTFAAYLVMSFLRYHDVKRGLAFAADWRVLVVPVLIVGAQSAALHAGYDAGWIALGSVVLLAMSFRDLRMYADMIQAESSPRSVSENRGS